MLPKIKLCFFFRKPDQKEWYRNFFCEILSKKFHVVIDEDFPDFIFHEAHLIDVLKFSGVRIAIAGENVRTDFNVSDYGIGFDHLTFQDRYIRFPLYLFYKESLISAEKRDEISLNQQADLQSRKFCNFLVSNGSATEFRTQFFHELFQYRAIDSGGRYLNNIGGPIVNKLKWQSEYKFSLCFENSSTSGYLTEKLIHAYAAKTIPIYWGDQDALGPLGTGKGGINSKAVVWVNQSNISEAICNIKELDSNSKAYFECLQQPLFLDDNHSSVFYKNLEFFLFSIFNQSKEEAYRRGFGQMRLRVEKRQRARTNSIKNLLNYFKRRIKL